MEKRQKDDQKKQRSTIIPFKDKFDRSLRLYALMTTKPSEMEKQKKNEPS